MVISGAPDILRKIVEAKRHEVERLKVELPVSELQDRIDARAAPLNFAGALMGDRVRVIAEIKKASPTRGLLRDDFDPVGLANVYADNGAAAISVLTNAQHFQGSIEHLEAVQAAVHDRGVPVLRKEFIFDPYQVYEARAHGADAILLIVAMLSPSQLSELGDLARRFWMQPLVEVHDEGELKTALDADADIVGINNRDLRTFVTDLAVTDRLAGLVPSGKIVVSESGVSSRDQVDRVGRAGAHAVLVGEALVAAEDVAAKLRELI
jgi:indole-3-glycerol phosphate synthase